MVTLPSGQEALATVALAYPYRPALGDTLLVIGQGGRHYVIGVIEGSGALAMAFAGDVNLHASGRLTLSADEGVTLRGPEVEVRARSLSVLAERSVQKFTSLLQRVRELFTVQAGEAETVVAGGALHRAKRTTILSQETVTVDGETILIG